MLKDKIKLLPLTPGVYLFKNSLGEVLYVGKASKLRSRVSQYFAFPIRDSREKIPDLMAEVTDYKTIDTTSEVEALFLESELIKRYQPKYNTDWKDERNFLYVRINFVSSYPAIEFVRRPAPDKATYIGPFIDSNALKKSMRYLRKVFPYSVHKSGSKINRACLDYHIGLCPGPEVQAITPEEYKKNLHRLITIIRGNTGTVKKEVEREMKSASSQKNFELAAILRDRAKALGNLSYKKVFALSEKYEGMADEGLTGLQNVLKINSGLTRIEAYDISNFAGKEAVGSMIVFEKGVPKRSEYKRFRIKMVRGIDDFKMMQEVLRRRLRQKWKTPDLILIDGGKGQLSAAYEVLTSSGSNVPAIGLAKREEEIVTLGYHELLNAKTFKIIKLSHSNPSLKLLQRIRDEAHRFAVLYHTQLRAKKMTRSFLDEVPGIGPETRRKLILHFGSLTAIKEADFGELSRVAGKSKAELIRKWLHKE